MSSRGSSVAVRVGRDGAGGMDACAERQPAELTDGPAGDGQMGMPREGTA